MVGNAAGLTFLGMGDFDGDRNQDLLWRASDGRIIGWKLNGLAVASVQQIANSTVVSSRLRVAGIGDLNGDGKDDVIWRRTGTGAVSAWLMNGLTLEAAGSIAANSPASWILVNSSDLDGNGKSDLLWRQKNNGDTHAWLMDGFTKVSSGFIRNASTSWAPIK